MCIHRLRDLHSHRDQRIIDRDELMKLKLLIVALNENVILAQFNLWESK